MDAVSHALLGHVAGRAMSRSGADRPHPLPAACATLGAVLPDVDHALELVSTQAYLAAHRGPTHSVLFGIAGALATAWLLRNRAGPTRLAAFSFAGFLTHVLTDLCTPYGIRPFWPLPGGPWSLDILPAAGPAVALLLGAGLLLVRFAARDRATGYRILLGILVGGLLCLGADRAARKGWWEARLPAGARPAGVVPHWLVPGRWIGLARVGGEGDERWRADEIGVGAVSRRIIGGEPGAVRPPPPGAPWDPATLRHIRFPARIEAAREMREAVVDLQYLAVWPDAKRVWQQSPFLLVSETEKKDGGLAWRSRNRWAAIALYAAVLSFAVASVRRARKRESSRSG